MFNQYIPNEDQILHDLEELKKEHQQLEEQIVALGARDQLQVQRLKREKLLVKDKMCKLEAMLHPDIIA